MARQHGFAQGLHRHFQGQGRIHAVLRAGFRLGVLQVHEDAMVGSEVGVLDELDMPAAFAVAFPARAQAFRQGIVHLAFVHGFAEWRADVQVDVGQLGEAFRHQAGAGYPGIPDGGVLGGLPLQLQRAVPHLEQGMALSADMRGNEIGEGGKAQWDPPRASAA